MSPIIKVENLSKAYRLGTKEDVPDTLIGALKSILKSPLRNLQELRSLDTSKADVGSKDIGLIWALRDVSFEVTEGEVVGIVGRNGAGKSTLLKILSRITEPTSGRAIIRGRVSSLLEVGTGFHPDLTGRENVYMNGTILGMTKREIDRKFDEIVSFSGVEKFLDTPAKRYSSGMQVRLAFAVAAHLEPEILIVDEVLAVGDAEFQQKCLAKMNDVARGGRTVLFVSHNLSAVRLLCDRAIVLSSGGVEADDQTSIALNLYSSGVIEGAKKEVHLREDRGGSGAARLTKVDVNGEGGAPISTGGALVFRFEFESDVKEVRCIFTIYDASGEPLMSLASSPQSDSDLVKVPDGRILECQIQECPLVRGSYRINVALHSGSDRLDHVEGAATFSVEDGFMRGRPSHLNRSFSKFVVPHVWVRT